MACIKPDGTLSGPGKALLRAMQESVELTDVAGISGMPLYRVRSVIRDLLDANLVSVEGSLYKTTEAGLEKIKE